jgi:hypothetical protein
LSTITLVVKTASSIGSTFEASAVLTFGLWAPQQVLVHEVRIHLEGPRALPEQSVPLGEVIARVHLEAVGMRSRGLRFGAADLKTARILFRKHGIPYPMLVAGSPWDAWQQSKEEANRPPTSQGTDILPPPPRVMAPFDLSQ